MGHLADLRELDTGIKLENILFMEGQKRYQKSKSWITLMLLSCCCPLSLSGCPSWMEQISFLRGALQLLEV